MKVRELFSDESKWTQGAYARDAEGSPTYIPCGVRWCLSGAVDFCYSGQQADPVYERIQTELRVEKLWGDGVARWNDSHTFAEVKALVEKLDI